MIGEQASLTECLRSFPGTDRLSIELSNHNGYGPYEWKIASPEKHLGYVWLGGSAIAGSHKEKCADLREQLKKLVGKQ